MLAKNHSVPCLTIKIENLCAMSYDAFRPTRHTVNCNLTPNSGEVVLHVAHIPCVQISRETQVVRYPAGVSVSAVRPTIESARLPPRMLGGHDGMTHARESSLSSLASCSRTSSPPTYPHRLRPRVGQPASLTSRHRAHFGPSARCASMQGSQRPSAVTSTEPLESTPLPPEI